jgi:hypothetical protein
MRQNPTRPAIPPTGELGRIFHALALAMEPIEKINMTLAREAETIELTDEQAYQLTALASGSHIQAEQLAERAETLRRRVEELTITNRNYWTEGAPR